MTLTNACLLGYSVSLVLGSLISLLFWWGIHYTVDRLYKPKEQEKAKRNRVMPIIMGFVERIIFTTLVGFHVEGSASFVGSWVMIKAIGGWSTVIADPEKKYQRALFMAGVLSSGVSAFMGIVGGIIIAKMAV